jgi:hypothetical protein
MVRAKKELVPESDTQAETKGFGLIFAHTQHNSSRSSSSLARFFRCLAVTYA